VPTDREIAEQLSGLVIRGDKEPLGGPSLAPLGFAEPRGIEVAAALRETPTAATDAHATGGDAALEIGETMLKDLEASALLEDLVPTRVAAHFSLTPTNRY
jgi:hypothetical protein